MIYFCFVQGDVTSVSHLAAQYLPAPAPHCYLSWSEQAMVGPKGQEIAFGYRQEEPQATPPRLEQIPIPLRGSRFTFYTDPREVPASRKHIYIHQA